MNNHWKILCASVAVVLTPLPSHTQVTTLVTFNGFDGANAELMTLTQGTDGDLYGTTFEGGVGGCSLGCGTVFKMNTAGTLVTLHSFDTVDGAYPLAGLVLGSDGSFYGTTSQGGTSAACAGGCGTVFKITSAGALQTLHDFDFIDGAYPSAGLIQGTNGNFYGTTSQGGTIARCTGGCGTVFQITPAGTLTTLHNFDSLDGAQPVAALLQAADGNFYGTTQRGGENDGGVVFSMTPNGRTLTALHSFCAGIECESDGSEPFAQLVQGTDGDFYGTTYAGGNYQGGTVFKITPSGTVTLLFDSFDGPNGGNPQGGLVQGPQGEFYGTTYNGGVGRGANCVGCGTVFSVSSSGFLNTGASPPPPSSRIRTGRCTGPPTRAVLMGTGRCLACPKACLRLCNLSQTLAERVAPLEYWEPL
jgi:uncharacterized repeat protein (TIGR03803 family)